VDFASERKLSVPVRKRTPVMQLARLCNDSHLNAGGREEGKTDLSNVRNND
jgi:hypothetical protein